MALGDGGSSGVADESSSENQPANRISKKFFGLWVCDGSYIKGTLKRKNRNKATLKTYARLMDAVHSFEEDGEAILLLDNENRAIGIIEELHA